jgi:IstB-like ATP binding protein
MPPSNAIATNESFSGWDQTFTDPRLCAAIVDRLTFRGNIIETGTDSYRLARARERKHAGTRPPVTAAGDPVPGVTLHPADTYELAEMLTFIAQWLARDPGGLAESLADLVGHPAYGIPQLRENLSQVTFLLGGSDGEQCGAQSHH